MSISKDTLAAARKYTNDSLAGAGAVKGAPCQIQSITAIPGGHRVTFLWVDNNGDSHTSTMPVMDGAAGQDGKGIQSVSVNDENHLIITYTDGTDIDAGQIEIHSAVDSVNGKTGAVTLDAEDVGALPANTPIPSQTSDLANDSGFITKVVNDLVNYYLKSETYSKTEVDAIITAVKNSRMEVVATLPTTDIKTNVIYLVPKSPSQTSNVKDEYINLDGTTAGWEKIGDTEIDLSNYVTTEALNTALAAYTTTADLTTLLAGKQDTLIFDNVPTENSNNPVKSGGVYVANQTLTNEVDTIINDLGAKNLFDIEKWLPTVGLAYTKNGDTYTTATGGTSYGSPFSFADADIDIIISGIITNDTSEYVRVEVLNVNNEVVATIKEDTTFASGKGCKVRLNWSVGGNFTIEKPIIRLASIKDDTYVPYSMTNQQITPYVQAISNPNLLDNPWFTVNQRGFSSKNDNGFTVDRWQILQAAGTVSLSNGVITIDPTVSGTTFLWGQTIENAHSKLAGKLVTLSVMLSDGTIKSKSFYYPTVSPSSRMISNIHLGSTHYFELYEYSSGHARVGYFNDGGVIPSASLTIKAVKLELGTVSTLAMDTAPNYAEELLKCQRYFLRISAKDASNWMLFCMVWSNSAMNYILSTPIEMRSVPTVSVSNIANFIICKGASTNSRKTGLGINCFEKISTSLVGTINVSETDLALGDMYVIKAGSANDFIDFSADL